MGVVNFSLMGDSGRSLLRGTRGVQDTVTKQLNEQSAFSTFSHYVRRHPDYENVVYVKK